MEADTCFHHDSLKLNSHTKKGVNMKKVVLAVLMIAAMASSAFAHHPSPSDSAGGNMSSSSGHLTNSYPAEVYGDEYL